MALRLKTAQINSNNEDIALKYVTYLASDSERMMAFFSLSGLGIDDLRTRLNDAAFQGFLLDILLQDESELLAFAAEHNLRPEVVMFARSKLPGFAQ